MAEEKTVLTLEDEIQDNSIWCGTFQLIWNDLKNDLAKQDIKFTPQLQVVENLKQLEEQGMYEKYGFYESIDYTPERVEKGKTASIVKTYMAHHQGLILLSINNLFNNNILQKRFVKNPEIEAVSILLQETMPETFIITKENKEKVEKLHPDSSQ